MCSQEDALSGHPRQQHIPVWWSSALTTRDACGGGTSVHPGMPLGTLNLLSLCFCHYMCLGASHAGAWRSLNIRSSVCFCPEKHYKWLLLALKMFFFVLYWVGQCLLQCWVTSWRLHWDQCQCGVKNSKACLASLKIPANGTANSKEHAKLCQTHQVLPLRAPANWSRAFDRFLCLQQFLAALFWVKGECGCLCMGLGLSLGKDMRSPIISAKICKWCLVRHKKGKLCTLMGF